MKNFLSLIFVLVQMELCFSQTKILSHIDYKTEDLKFYITRNNRGVVVINDSDLIRFIIQDTNTLRMIIDTWEGTKPVGIYRCGYDYNIKVTTQNKIIESISINSECKQLICSMGYFDFKINPLENLNTELKFSEFIFSTHSAKRARKFLNSVVNQKDIYVPLYESYFWNKYGGRFMIQIPRKAEPAEGFTTDYYENGMHNLYPSDDFAIEFCGFGDDSYQAWIYCNRNFRKAFSLYKKGKWEKADRDLSVLIFGNTEAVKLISCHNSVRIQ